MNLLKTFIIKELLLDDTNPESGIQAVSMVSDPAIMEKFIYFNKDLKMTELAQEKTDGGAYIRDFYKYTAEPEPETIDTSHDFCKKHAGKVYHISEIRQWGSLNFKENGFIEGVNFFSTFSGFGSFNCNQQIYNCRHWLKQCKNIKEIPVGKRQESYRNYYTMNKQTDLSMEFKISNKERHEISGLALQSGQFIYRNDINGLGPGYVYFSRDTVRKLKERYGFNRSITIEHKENITGTCILLDSWLEEDDEKNMTRWFLKYKVIDDTLWNAIKLGLVSGYSIEALLEVR
jgi:hypothetical protein